MKYVRTAATTKISRAKADRNGTDQLNVLTNKTRPSWAVQLQPAFQTVYVTFKT